MTKKYDEKTLKKIAEIDLLQFIKYYKINNEQNNLIEFKNHLFLYDIFNDWSPNQVFLKAAQLGMSTLMILKTLWAAKNKNIEIIYTLPTHTDAADFSSSKVNRIINANPILKDWASSRDTIFQKQIGGNIIYYRGTFVEKAAVMITADLLVVDELDRSDQSTVETYESRLQHSQYKWKWYLSNPSFTGTGISKMFENSNQNHWMIKCNKCNKEDFLSYPESIEESSTGNVFICKLCKQVMTDENRRIGRWVSKYPDRNISGYWMNLMIAPWISADEIVKAKKEKSEQFFLNFVMGQPFTGADATVAPDIIYKNCNTNLTNNFSKVVIGVDVGKTCHYVVGNSQGVFLYGKTEDPEHDLSALLNRFHGSIMVIDRGPDIFLPQKLKEVYKGRVFLCSFNRDKQSQNIFHWKKGDDYGSVSADRNRAIQLLIDELTDSRIILQGRWQDYQDFYSHFKSMYRTSENDAYGNPQIVWQHSGPDHWCLALCYWRIGMDKYGNSGEAQVFTSTPNFYTYSTSADAPIIETMRRLKRGTLTNADWRNF